MSSLRGSGARSSRYGSSESIHGGARWRLRRSKAAPSLRMNEIRGRTASSCNRKELADAFKQARVFIVAREQAIVMRTEHEPRSEALNER